MMIDVEAGRHPVITAMLGEREQYVPNNTHLNVSVPSNLPLYKCNTHSKHLFKILLLIII